MGHPAVCNGATGMPNSVVTPDRAPTRLVKPNGGNSSDPRTILQSPRSSGSACPPMCKRCPAENIAKPRCFGSARTGRMECDARLLFLYLPLRQGDADKAALISDCDGDVTEDDVFRLP